MESEENLRKKQNKIKKCLDSGENIYCVNDRSEFSS